MPVLKPLINQDTVKSALSFNPGQCHPSYLLVSYDLGQGSCSELSLVLTLSTDPICNRITVEKNFFSLSNLQ
jgi:hypothetical protein